MSVIVPTVTADNPHTYREQIERVAAFANRIHIDTADGQLAPIHLMEPERIWWPAGLRVDVHMMFQKPAEAIQPVLAIHPDLIILHAEAEGQFLDLADLCHQEEVAIGLAVLQKTPIRAIEPVIASLDHVMIFSGNLGHFGGQVDFDLLTKVKHLRQLKPELEIGWDGGVNLHNAKQLAEGGIDILNVGGAIHRAHNPREAYHALSSRIG